MDANHSYSPLGREILERLSRLRRHDFDTAWDLVSPYFSSHRQPRHGVRPPSPPGTPFAVVETTFRRATADHIRRIVSPAFHTAEQSTALANAEQAFHNSLYQIRLRNTAAETGHKVRHALCALLFGDAELHSRLPRLEEDVSSLQKAVEALRLLVPADTFATFVTTCAAKFLHPSIQSTSAVRIRGVQDAPPSRIA